MFARTFKIFVQLINACFQRKRNRLLNFSSVFKIEIDEIPEASPIILAQPKGVLMMQVSIVYLRLLLSKIPSFLARDSQLFLAKCCRSLT